MKLAGAFVACTLAVAFLALTVDEGTITGRITQGAVGSTEAFSGLNLWALILLVFVIGVYLISYFLRKRKAF